jgi:hypothetical protein
MAFTDRKLSVRLQNTRRQGGISGEIFDSCFGASVNVFPLHCDSSAMAVLLGNAVPSRLYWHNSRLVVSRLTMHNKKPDIVVFCAIRPAVFVRFYILLGEYVRRGRVGQSSYMPLGEACC